MVILQHVSSLLVLLSGLLILGGDEIEAYWHAPIPLMGLGAAMFLLGLLLWLINGAWMRARHQDPNAIDNPSRPEPTSDLKPGDNDTQTSFFREAAQSVKPSDKTKP